MSNFSASNASKYVNHLRKVKSTRHLKTHLIHNHDDDQVERGGSDGGDDLGALQPEHAPGAIEQRHHGQAVDDDAEHGREDQQQLRHGYGEMQRQAR